jgi:glycosyltransferase involved in cell wall biosynthesis
MKQNRILIINDTLKFYGGAESYIYSLKNLLEKHDYKVEILGGKSGIGLIDSFLARWFSIKYYREVKEKIKTFQPDIVHIHNFARVVSPSVLLACNSAKIPIIQTVHDYHYICPKLWMIDDKNQEILRHNSAIECLLHHLPKKNFIYSYFKFIKSEFHKKFLNKIDLFICPSKDLARWYTKRYGINKVSFLPNFSDESIFKYSSLKNYNQLLYVGRLSNEKGIILLINAFALVVTKFPHLKLFIIGNGKEKNNIITIIKNLNLDNNIQIISNVKHHELYKYYKECSLVVIPSIWIENCPMVALESIMSGRAIVASNAGGLKDLIEENKTGMLFERDNLYDLSQKLIKLYTNEYLLNKFHLNTKKIRTSYNSFSHFRKIDQIYKSFLK